MLFQYICNVDPKLASASAITFVGRKEIVAKKLQVDVVNQLVADPDFVRSVDTFIISMMGTYKLHDLRGKAVTELLSARGELLANCGRCLLGLHNQCLLHSCTS